MVFQDRQSSCLVLHQSPFASLYFRSILGRNFGNLAISIYSCASQIWKREDLATTRQSHVTQASKYLNERPATVTMEDLRRCISVSLLAPSTSYAQWPRTTSVLQAHFKAYFFMWQSSFSNGEASVWEPFITEKQPGDICSPNPRFETSSNARTSNWSSCRKTHGDWDTLLHLVGLGRNSTTSKVIIFNMMI